MNEIAGNLMQRQSLGNQLLATRRTVNLPDDQVSIAVTALAGILYRHELLKPSGNDRRAT
jgi:hypothetical protein